MLYLTAETQIMLALQPVDFRKQIDGLVALCDGYLKQNSRSGVLYVFINRARTHIRVLCHDGSGYWLVTKRLSRGRFTNWPKSQDFLSHASASELTKILKICLVNS